MLNVSNFYTMKNISSIYFDSNTREFLAACSTSGAVQVINS